MNTLMEKETHRMPAKHTAEVSYLLPAVNIIETGDSYVIDAEMPGVNREGLVITLEGNTLTLTGRRNIAPPRGEALYVESKPAGFQRVFELDPTVDTSKVSAHLEQGLLRLHLPKAERVKPRKIMVND